MSRRSSSPSSTIRASEAKPCPNSSGFICPLRGSGVWIAIRRCRVSCICSPCARCVLPLPFRPKWGRREILSCSSSRGSVPSWAAYFPCCGSASARCSSTDSMQTTRPALLRKSAFSPNAIIPAWSRSERGRAGRSDGARRRWGISPSLREACLRSSINMPSLAVKRMCTAFWAWQRLSSLPFFCVCRAPCGRRAPAASSALKCAGRSRTFARVRSGRVFVSQKISIVFWMSITS